MRVDYLDHRGKGLYDLPFPSMSPFDSCRKHLALYVTSGNNPRSPLKPLFKQFSDGTARGDLAIMNRIREMGMDMGAQIFWRFRHLRELPFSMADWVNPGLSHLQQKAKMRDDWAMKPCCADPDCFGKLRDLFPDGKTPGNVYLCAVVWCPLHRGSALPICLRSALLRCGERRWTAT